MREQVSETPFRCYPYYTALISPQAAQLRVSLSYPFSLPTLLVRAVFEKVIAKNKQLLLKQGFGDSS